MVEAFRLCRDPLACEGPREILLAVKDEAADLIGRTAVYIEVDGYSYQRRKP